MYYHWLAETLPRIALLNAAMDADTMLLTWGMEHELEWLDKLGIDRKRCAAAMHDMHLVEASAALAPLNTLALLPRPPSRRIVRYDPDQVYCATELLYPNPSPRITPAREGLLRLREAVGAAEPLPAEERQSIVRPRPLLEAPRGAS
ncbi:unnamed protein product [Pedinophyceae sp. YPF-701]|nr:unnamed protein product [Pedinophyceae sp. YPF-701]